MNHREYSPGNRLPAQRRICALFVLCLCFISTEEIRAEGGQAFFSESTYDVEPGLKWNALLEYFHAAYFPYLYSYTAKTWVWILGTSETDGFYLYRFDDQSWGWSSPHHYPEYYAFTKEEWINWGPAETLAPRALSGRTLTIYENGLPVNRIQFEPGSFFMEQMSYAFDTLGSIMSTMHYDGDYTEISRSGNLLTLDIDYTWIEVWKRDLTHWFWEVNPGLESVFPDHLAGTPETLAEEWGPSETSADLILEFQSATEGWADLTDYLTDGDDLPFGWRPFVID